jgi:hypothetical protein
MTTTIKALINFYEIYGWVFNANEENRSLFPCIMTAFQTMLNKILVDEEQSMSDFYNKDKHEMWKNFKPLSECDVIIEEFKQNCNVESEHINFENFLTTFSHKHMNISIPSFIVETFQGAKCFQIGDD